jgi:hypothetical protein
LVLFRLEAGYLTRSFVIWRKGMSSKILVWLPLLLISPILACSLGGQAQQAPNTAVSTATNTVNTATPPISTTTATPTSPSATETSTPLTSATPEVPSDVILVDSFDQEVYPFKQDDDCSLGEAIWAVQIQKTVDGCTLRPSSTTIYLPTGIYSLTDEDNSPISMPGNTKRDRLGLDPAGFPVIFSRVTILGNGSTIQRSGPHKFGIFQVFVLGDLTINELTISGGDSTEREFAGADGGAFQITGGQVKLKHVTLTGNRGENGGAMVISGGKVEMDDCVVRANTATSEGGGIYNDGELTLKGSAIASNIAESDVFGGGGIYNESGQLTLNHSRVEGNRAGEGGGIYNDGGRVNITNSSMVAANLATETNADIPHGGGGINNIGDGAQVTVSDSFILGNHAEKTTGGGIYNQATLNVANSVLAYNVSGGGGALFNDDLGNGAISNSCIIKNTVVDVTPAGLGSGIESGSETPFAASKNWWGAADGPGPFGPGSGDSVTHNVTFSDFLKTAPAICAVDVPTPAIP